MKLYLYHQLRSRPFLLHRSGSDRILPFTTKRRSPNFLLSEIATLSTS
ncbi:hypothetical protein [Coleofasciculus sp. FACHB-SPT36]|nr:hypothetical protein [Coleofasciculus sp. FACHB-SPT36]MBD2542197.1 hypothetical protein [Coleofasciculus sp. FACHB-SPT36]